MVLPITLLRPLQCSESWAQFHTMSFDAHMRFVAGLVY